MSDDMQRRLQDYLARAFPDRRDVQVGPPADISSGWESEIYAFGMEYGPATARQRENLILRLYLGEAARAKCIREYHSMRQLHQSGYPVPWVHLLEYERSPFGRPFVIMEKIDGQALWTLMSGAPPRQQPEWVTLFCQLFVRLHQLDWRHFTDDPVRYDTGNRYIFVDQWLASARDILHRFSQVNVAPIIAWLEQRRDNLPCLRPSPVHQDYHPNNVLIRADGSPVVIDWTGFDIMDLRFDLAWTLVLAYAYAGAEVRDVFLHEYERLTGAAVEHVECFEVFACARRLFDVAVSLAEGAERVGLRPEAAALIKEQMSMHQRVYELAVARTGIRLVEFERLFASPP